MLDIRFAGLPRFITGPGPLMPPDNYDGTDLTEAMAGGRLPSFARSGINWTKHLRPPRPKGRGTSGKHLKLVK